MLREFKKFDLEGINEDEDDRLEKVQIARLRGKGCAEEKEDCGRYVYPYDGAAIRGLDRC